MADVGHARYGRLLVAGMLLVTLVACQRVEEVQIGASGLPPAPPAVAEPATVFQGSVVSVDAGAGVLVVEVTIVWTPVITAGGHERRVLVDAGTRWERGLTLAALRLGEEVQVDAGDPVDGSWPALRVRLFDID